LKRGLLLYFLFLLICSAFYALTAPAKLSYDLLDFLLQYKNEGAGGFLHNFNDASVRPFFHLNQFIGFKLFGMNYWGWHATSISLHTLDALLLLVLTERILKLYRINAAQQMAFFSALLFLISPYHTETVVWGCTLHYHTTLACMLAILLLFLRFLQSGNMMVVCAIGLLYLIGYFSLEYMLIMPFMLIAMYVFLKDKLQGNGRKAWMYIIVPQILLIPLFFVVNKLVLGIFVGHYGANLHLNFRLPDIAFNAIRYFFNYTLFLEYLPAFFREQLLFIGAYPIQTALAMAAIATMWYVFFIKDYFPDRANVLLLFSILCLLCLSPIINLKISGFYLKQSDRMGYPGNGFFCVILVQAIFLFPAYLRYCLLTLYIICSAFILAQNCYDWKMAGETAQALVADYLQKFPEEQVCILGEADNFNGAYIFTPNVANGRFRYDLDKRLALETGKDYSHKIKHLLQFEMLQQEDGVQVSNNGSNHITIQTTNPAGRLIKKYKPAASFEDSTVKATVNDEKNNCVLIFKQPPAHKLIYQQGRHWNIAPGY
jgi:hypothetical protein